MIVGRVHDLVRSRHEGGSVYLYIDQDRQGYVGLKQPLECVLCSQSLRPELETVSIRHKSKEDRMELAMSGAIVCLQRLTSHHACGGVSRL